MRQQTLVDYDAIGSFQINDPALLEVVAGAALDFQTNVSGSGADHVCNSDVNQPCNSPTNNPCVAPNGVCGSNVGCGHVSAGV